MAIVVDFLRINDFINQLTLVYFNETAYDSNVHGYHCYLLHDFDWIYL